jgi:hypothetical protein
LPVSGPRGQTIFHRRNTVFDGLGAAILELMTTSTIAGENSVVSIVNGKGPADWEAQVGQGSITFPSEEHLASSDRGVAGLRRFFRKQIEIVAAGGDSAGTVFDDSRAMVAFKAGNYLEDPAHALA